MNALQDIYHVAFLPDLSPKNALSLVGNRKRAHGLNHFQLLSGRLYELFHRQQP
jgi:hypothetical protein